jgi:transcriptional regulator with XRE-family HTH domain
MMTFGEKMRALMGERGVSLRGLAKRVNYDAGYLSKVANGLKRPSAPMAERLDAALDANGELVALVSPGGQGRVAADTAASGERRPDDEERLMLAARRPSRLDLTVVESLSAILAAQRRTEDVVGSGPLLGPVAAQLDTIGAFVVEARGPIRPKVMHVAAQWAQFFGWLKAGTGRLAEGKAWLDRALAWALEADDVNLTSEVLSFKGHVAWMAGQIGPMIGLSAAALRGDGLYPGQRAISAVQEGRGHAIAGDVAATERRLAEADEYAASARERVEEAPPWLYYHSPAFFDLQRGLAYRHLAVTHPAYNDRAIRTLTSGLERLPADMRDSEWAGDFVYHLGRAHVQAGEREHALALAGRLDELARRTGARQVVAKASALRSSTVDVPPC